MQSRRHKWSPTGPERQKYRWWYNDRDSRVGGHFQTSLVKKHLNRFRISGPARMQRRCPATQHKYQSGFSAYLEVAPCTVARRPAGEKSRVPESQACRMDLFCRGECVWLAGRVLKKRHCRAGGCKDTPAFRPLKTVRQKIAVYNWCRGNSKVPLTTEFSRRSASGDLLYGPSAQWMAPWDCEDLCKFICFSRAKCAII